MLLLKAWEVKLTRLFSNKTAADSQCRGPDPRNESGQGLVEYLLIVGLIVVAASQVSRKFIYTLDRLVLRVGADLERDLKSGRAPLGVWSN
jgi:hypothetical protein